MYHQVPDVKWAPWDISRVSCQKSPTRHAYAWQIGPFWQDTLDIAGIGSSAIILGIASAHERRRYKVTTYLMDLAHNKDDRCIGNQ